MKTNKEIAASVFEKSRVILKKRAVRRKRIAAAGTTLGIAAIVTAAALLGKGAHSNDIPTYDPASDNSITSELTVPFTSSTSPISASESASSDSGDGISGANSSSSAASAGSQESSKDTESSRSTSSAKRSDVSSKASGTASAGSRQISSSVSHGDESKPSSSSSSDSKTTISKTNSSRTTSSKNNSSKTTSSKNNSSKITSSKNNSSKTTSSKNNSSKTTSSKNNSSKTTSSKNNNSKTTSSKNNSSKTTSSKNNSSKTTSSKNNSSKSASSRVISSYIDDRPDHPLVDTDVEASTDITDPTVIDDEEPRPNAPADPASENIRFITVYKYEEDYSTASELIRDADLIVTARVESIGFEPLRDETATLADGVEITAADDKNGSSIVTLYRLNVIDSVGGKYSAAQGSDILIYVYGGHPYYDESWQAWNAGSDSINILGDVEFPMIDNKYVFVLDYNADANVWTLHSCTQGIASLSGGESTTRGYSAKDIIDACK